VMTGEAAIARPEATAEDRATAAFRLGACTRGPI